MLMLTLHAAADVLQAALRLLSSAAMVADHLGSCLMPAHTACC
jgi:hypothetical protein